jgi:hypothetical protein
MIKNFIDHFTDPLEYWRLKWCLAMMFYIGMFIVIWRY